jgi:hypothetical protein
VDRRRVASPAQMRLLLDAICSTGKSQGLRLVALFGCMYYGMLRPSEAVSLLPRWPSGPVAASRSCTASTHIASMGRMSGGTSGWRSSLASLKSASVRQAVAVSRAELARWPGSHSAYIPGPATFGDFWWHTAAQRFNRRRIVCAAQAGTACS